MGKLYYIGILLVGFLLSACDWQIPTSNEGIVEAESPADTLLTTDMLAAKVDSTPVDNLRNIDTALIPQASGIDIKSATPDGLVDFAETLIGTPYVYASTNPKVGFDCSGFITYVFNHFNISVPRSSIDFTNVGKDIPVEAAKRGDIILFTGTNPAERHVGHMGLVTSNSDSTLQFIHSTSGKAKGVTITPLSSYYKSRFVKVIRLFPHNDVN